MASLLSAYKVLPLCSSALIKSLGHERLGHMLMQVLSIVHL